MKLGFAGKGKVTEEGGHRHGAKKQLNSVKLAGLLGRRELDRGRRAQVRSQETGEQRKAGLPYGDNRTERRTIEAIVFQQKTVHF